MGELDNPDIIENKDMVSFLKRHNHVFVYNYGTIHSSIEKYLKSINIDIKGFIVNNKEDLGEKIYSFSEIKEKFGKRRFYDFRKKIRKNSCVIIADEPSSVSSGLAELKKIGFKDFFYVSKWNRRTIPYKMTPREKNNFWIEVNLVDHCNLNCQCCDHFSPIADKYFLDIDEFEKDIKRLSELMNGEMGVLKLEGGEPLLHPNAIDFMKIARKYFPKSKILFFSNGILLASMEKIFETIKEYDITLMVTTYPIKTDYRKIDELAKKYEIKYERFIEASKLSSSNKEECLDKLSVHHPFNLKGEIEDYQYISCYHFNECITLRHGKIYTCPIIPYSEYFNKEFNRNLKIKPDCCIDIYKAKNYKEIADFCTKKVSFCSYCDILNRKAKPYALSKKEISEWS
ncbi:MAG: radical SAM protein [Candidatus Gastranaerophilales bacterium]|nr:radical SAM protein [Candidatus Gastranaerophilales bacterium]